MGSAPLDLAAIELELDELWSFVGMKEKTRQRNGIGEEYGDCYTWTAIESRTKLLLAYAVGKRDGSTGMEFAGKLRRATGWAPVFSLEQTLRDTLEYWQRQAV